MGGRLYDPQLGRFLSPDPYVADPTMGQDWNAYSYVANSPMSYLDPTGHVRTGPMCSLAVRCAADDSGGHPGGGFTRTAQAYQASASFLLSVPVLTVDWGFVGGFGPGFGRGSDYGRAAWAPQVRLGFATYPVSFAVPGSLRVDGENPADEPMTGDQGRASAEAQCQIMGGRLSGCDVEDLLDSDRRFPPVAPIGADIDANILEAEGRWNPFWFYDQVRSHGPWDYKRIDRIYEDFGNFNYGATGRAMGFPEAILLNEAGRYGVEHGESDTEWGRPGPPGLPLFGTPPYGDDPRDQYWIRQGMDYYENRHRWNRPIQLEPPP